jgi:hypothetical protein
MQKSSGTGTVTRELDPRGAATLTLDCPQADNACNGDLISGRGVTDCNDKEA